MVMPSVLPGRAYQQVDVRSRCLVSFRAADLLRAYQGGVPTLRALHGAAGTFSRNSASGRVVTRGAPVSSSNPDGLKLGPDLADNAPQFGYFQNPAGVYVPALVLGRQYTNKRATALGSWTPTNASITSTTALDPRGGTGAVQITAAAGAGEHNVRNAPSTAIGGISGDVYLKAATHQYARYWFYNATDASLGYVSVNLATGEVINQAGIAGFFYRVTKVGDWVRIQLGGLAQTVANSTAYISFVDAGGNAVFTATGSESIYAWDPTLYQDKVPPEQSLAASVSRATDSLVIPFNAAPQPMTVLYEWVALDLPNLGEFRQLFSVGGGAYNTNAAGIKAFFVSGSSTLYVKLANGTSNVQAYFDVSALKLGDIPALRVYWNGVDAPIARLSVNGGPETKPTNYNPLPFPSAWDDTIIRICAASYANSGLVSFKAAPGYHTLQQMQEII